VRNLPRLSEGLFRSPKSFPDSLKKAVWSRESLFQWPENSSHSRENLSGRPEASVGLPKSLSSGLKDLSAGWKSLPGGVETSSGSRKGSAADLKDF
jgi:hypothetical protein